MKFYPAYTLCPQQLVLLYVSKKSGIVLVESFSAAVRLLSKVRRRWLVETRRRRSIDAMNALIAARRSRIFCFVCLSSHAHM